MDCHKHCGVHKTLKIIGSKWAMMILHNLFDGPKRFGSLYRSLEGISPKTLSQRLKELEQEEIIKRQVFAQVPLKVEYSLTKKGESLGDIFIQIAHWGETIH